MLPVGMAVPIAAAGVKHAQRRTGDHDRTAPVGATMTTGAGMKSPAAAAGGIGRCKGGKRDTRGEGDCKNSLHDSLSDGELLNRSNSDSA